MGVFICCKMNQIKKPKVSELEALYQKYNRRAYVHPDPLELLYPYDDPADREVVGFVASALAYGRVAHILKSATIVLKAMPEPARFVRDADEKTLRGHFGSFTHRFTTGDELVRVLLGLGAVLNRYGSLQNCFLKGMREDDETVIPALSFFIREIAVDGAHGFCSLLADPAKTSACKRLHLFLRWMVRHDDVDPGDWVNVPPNKLIVPLDTHMLRIGQGFGLTNRKNATILAAFDVTRGFRQFIPSDPVKYDFCLTRFGIRSDLSIARLFEKE